jgi:hypothetical protein
MKEAFENYFDCGSSSVIESAQAEDKIFLSTVSAGLEIKLKKSNGEKFFDLNFDLSETDNFI